MVFSFSQKVWEDMLHGYMVFQKEDNYHIVTFSNIITPLPRPDQQRSVLIDHYVGKVIDIHIIPKAEWKSYGLVNQTLIEHFLKNNNNHTQSDWNYVRNTRNSYHLRR